MQIEITSDTIAIAVGTFTITGAIIHMTARLVRIELKVETLWKFMMRRGLSEGVKRGIMTIDEAEEEM